MKAEISIPLIVGVIMGAVAIVILADRNRKLTAELSRQASVLAEKTDSLRYERNAKGQLVASKTAAEVSLRELRDHYGHELTAIREELGVKDRNLRAFMTAQFQAVGQGTTTIIHNHYDSAGVVHSDASFTIRDGYLDLLGIIDSTALSYQYTYTDSVLQAFHVERKWLLGKQTLYSTARLSNPNAKITGSTSVLVRQATDKRWVIMLGGGYDPFLGQPTLGVYAGYALFKF